MSKDDGIFAASHRGMMGSAIVRKRQGRDHADIGKEISIWDLASAIRVDLLTKMRW